MHQALLGLLRQEQQQRQMRSLPHRLVEKSDVSQIIIQPQKEEVG